MRRTLVTLVLALAVLAPACGDDDGSSGEVPTVEELAAGLLTEDDLGEEWTSATPPDFDGVVTDEMRAEGPGLEMCEEAGDEAVAANASLLDRMQVIASLDLTVDRADVGSVHLTEMSFADDPDVVADLYRTLEDGFRTCLEVEPDPDEAVLEVRQLDLPEVGDDRFGFLLSLGYEPDRWDLRSVMVADGSVFVGIGLNEIHRGEPVLSDAELADIITTAIDKLP